MIVGETVTVYVPVQTGTDAFNAPTLTETPLEVDNVVIRPGPSTEVQDGVRPDGAVIAYTLYFPKTFATSVQGCNVEVRGSRCRVVGFPQVYTEQNVPGPWNMVAEVEVVDG